MDNKLSELSKPVAYSLRFRNMNGEPDKTINANTTFSTLEKAKAYGLGIRYVTQDNGKIVRVRDPSQDPIVEPLYSQEYVSALLAELEAKDKRIAELSIGRVGNALLERENHHVAVVGKMLERIAELESIATDYAGKFQKAQDAAKHLIIMNDSAQAEIAYLKALLATPVRLKKVDSSNVPFAGDGFNAAVDYCTEAVRAAGFTVGDE